MQRVVGDGEGARDLDHLALADGQVANDILRADAVAGEDPVQTGADQVSGLAGSAPAVQGGMADTGVLGDAKVGAQRQFLKHAAHTQGAGGLDRPGGLRRPVNGDKAGVGRVRPGQNAHQSRLAGPVMADKPDTFAGANQKVHPVEGADGAIAFPDAVQPCNAARGISHDGQG